VLGVSIMPLSTIFRLKLGTVPTVLYLSKSKFDVHVELSEPIEKLTVNTQVELSEPINSCFTLNYLNLLTVVSH
jgi:hypothetical protein